MTTATLLDSLSKSLAAHPGHHEFTVQVLQSQPRRAHSLFPHATNQATVKIWQEEVLVHLSETVAAALSTSSPSVTAAPATTASTLAESATKAAPSLTSANDVSPASTPTVSSKTLPVAALESNIYTVPATSTSLIYISKVDTTGLVAATATSPSPTRALVSAFISHYLAHPPHNTKRVRFHIFARAQGQYLFPGSVENAGKKVLDDKGLIRWWKATLSQAAAVSVVSREASTSSETPTQLFYLIPGLTHAESLPYVPLSTMSTVPWIYGHPYNTVTSPLHLPATTSTDPSPPSLLADLIPNFPDDPKARFITSLTSSTIAVAGSEGDYDDLTASLHARAFTTNSSSTTLSTQLANLERDRAIERKRLDPTEDGRVAGGVEEFWERMAFRQECCMGALVAFFVVVKDGEVDQSEVVPLPGASSGGKAPKPERGSVDQNLFTRLWSQFHNVDYCSKSGGERLEMATKKWEHDVEACVKSDGYDFGGVGQGKEESEEDFKARRRQVYEAVTCRKVKVDNPELVRTAEKRDANGGEEKKVNVLAPRKKKKVA